MITKLVDTVFIVRLKRILPGKLLITNGEASYVFRRVEMLVYVIEVFVMNRLENAGSSTVSFM